MNRTVRRCTTALVLALAVLLVNGSAAYATTTVVTDPTGDASLCNGTAPVNHRSVCPVPSPDSDPTIDIVSADVGSSATADVVARLHVLDLDDPLSSYRKDTHYIFSTWVNGTTTIIQLDAERHGDATVGKLRVAGPGVGTTVITPVVFDFATNTVRWDLTLTRLNELLDVACPSCTDLAVGSDLNWFSLYTSASQLSVYAEWPTGGETSGELVNKVDDAFTDLTYAIGS